jgi:hypothetical protein
VPAETTALVREDHERRRLIGQALLQSPPAHTHGSSYLHPDGPPITCGLERVTGFNGAGFQPKRARVAHLLRTVPTAGSWGLIWRQSLEDSMRSRIAASLLLGVLAIVPASAAAQEQPPDRLPTDQQQVAPEDKPEAVGACGTDEAAVVDRAPFVNIAPPDNTNKNGDMSNGLSAIRGTIVHSEGNLLLVRQLELPSLGTTTPGGQARPSQLAVVRLPAECAPGSLIEGKGVIAVGTATPEGILNAQSVQPGD